MNRRSEGEGYEVDVQAQVLENSGLAIDNNIRAPVQEAAARQMDVIPIAHQMDVAHHGAIHTKSTTNTRPISDVASLVVRYIPLFSKDRQSAILETFIDGVAYTVVAQTGATYHYSSDWDDVDTVAGVIEKKMKVIGQLVNNWLKVNVVIIDRNWRPPSIIQLSNASVSPAVRVLDQFFFCAHGDNVPIPGPPSILVGTWHSDHESVRYRHVISQDPCNHRLHFTQRIKGYGDAIGFLQPSRVHTPCYHVEATHWYEGDLRRGDDLAYFVMLRYDGVYLQLIYRSYVHGLFSGPFRAWRLPQAGAECADHSLKRQPCSASWGPPSMYDTYTCYL